MQVFLTYAGLPWVGTSYSNDKLLELEVCVMGETVSGRDAPLAGAPALRPLSELLSIVAQLLIVNFGTAGQPAGTTPGRIPPVAQGASSEHLQRGPSTALPSPQGCLRRSHSSGRSRRSSVRRTGQAAPRALSLIHI